MSIEIEAKLKVDSLREIKSRLVELGAEFLEEQFHKDTYFDDTGDTLKNSDRCLRLRRQRVGQNEKILLTYKGAKEKDNFKKRQEIEIEVQNGDAVEKLLSALGYKRALTIEKTRRTWRLADCVVALDDLPVLGSFVEIEGPDDKRIADAQKNLGLADLPHILESYALLVEQNLRCRER